MRTKLEPMKPAPPVIRIESMGRVTSYELRVTSYELRVTDRVGAKARFRGLIAGNPFLNFDVRRRTERRAAPIPELSVGTGTT